MPIFVTFLKLMLSQHRSLMKVSFKHLLRQNSQRRHYIALLSLAFTTMLGASQTNAEIYSLTDKNGNTLYTDQKPASNAEAKVHLKKTNSYSTNKVLKTVKLSPKNNQASNSHVLNTNTNVKNKGKAIGGWDEKQCQESYGYSCDQVINWKKYAIESCGNDNRCEDEQYLERKYKPVTIEKLQAVARRAAIRKNRQSDEITQFLKQKYTDYCDTQASLNCKNDANCSQIVLNACQDPRSLDDIFSKYDKLTVQDRNKIIAQARSLSMSNGANLSYYNKKLADLLSLLVTQTLLGF